jgi:hypothetical protein
MEMTTSIAALSAALAKAQAEIKGALKDSANPFYKSKYADLSSVWEACRKPLTDNQLSVIQTVAGDTSEIIVTTMLTHSSGEWVRDSVKATPAKQDPQGMGSAITYLRRYALAAITGVAPEDDDGNAASTAKNPEQPVASKIGISAKEKKEIYEQTISCLADGDEHGVREIWHPYSVEEKAVLGGMFNSEQKAALREILRTGIGSASTMNPGKHIEKLKEKL